LIRAKGGMAEQELADWWGRFQHADLQQREAMLLPVQTETGKRKRRRRPRHKTESAAAPVSEHG
jgi:poly(A) polymerase